MQERLQKYLSRCGVASRRRAELMIAAGRVAVNGEAVTQLGSKVDAENDAVTLDGKAVSPPQALAYVAMHKPAGYLTTREDPHGRPTIRNLLPKEHAHLKPVGRLDNRSEGLIFLSDDGAWAHRVAHPRFGGEKEYAVLVKGTLTEQQFETLRGPMTLAGYKLNRVAVQMTRREGDDTWIAMTLTEGRKRQIRQMLAAVGKQAVRLIRTRIGPVRLDGLAPGKLRPLTPAEVDHWRKAPPRQSAKHTAKPPAERQSGADHAASPGTGDDTAILADSAVGERDRDQG